ncbi:MAG: hypothetical protein AVDCRST_MAG12-3762, partial [uncultured Rubrobacteraceae bacterium]
VLRRACGPGRKGCPLPPGRRRPLPGRRRRSNPPRGNVLGGEVRRGRRERSL